MSCQIHTTSIKIFLFILITTLMAAAPMFFLGYHTGHDIYFHVASWMDASQQFRQIILFPRWAGQANYGFGEPRFIFYPPLSWTTGGILGLFVPWTLVPALFVWLSLTLGGINTFIFTRRWLPPRQAAMAAIIFAVNPYAIVTSYARCAYGELLASAFFPLLLWAFYEVAARGRVAAPLLASALALIWMADYPAGVIAIYSLGVLLIVHWILCRSSKTLLWVSLAAAQGLCLDAFCLLPSAREMRWVYIGAVLKPFYLPWNNFLFEPGVVPFQRKISVLATALALAAALVILLSRSARRTLPSLWWPLTVLGGVSTFMMLPISSFFWKNLPEMRFIQFPWRWLFPLALVSATLTAFTLARTRSGLLWLAAAAVLFAVDARTVLTAQWGTSQIVDLASAIASNRGYEGFEAFTPVGANFVELFQAELSAKTPLVASDLSCRSAEAEVRVEKWSPVYKKISVKTVESVGLDLKLLGYPGWQARINGKNLPTSTNASGQIHVQVPPGVSNVEVIWRTTADHIAGAVLSLLAVAAVLLFVC